jgi:predicted nucleic acid-binding protein
MGMRVVLDSGPIIHLSWIGRLPLLDALFEELFLPPAVRDEVIAAPSATIGLESIAATLKHGRLLVHPVRSSETLPAALGAGEREAILLAEEIGADLLISDDTAARLIASQRGILFTGTLGILRDARDRALISSALPLVLELRKRGLWLSEALIELVRHEEGEASR